MPKDEEGLNALSPENPVRWGLRGAAEEGGPEGENELFVVPVGCVAKEDEKSESGNVEPEAVVVAVFEVLCDDKGVIELPLVVAVFGLGLLALEKEKEDATLEISVAPGFRALFSNEKAPNPVNCCCCSCGGWGCCCCGCCCCCC